MSIFDVHVGGPLTERDFEKLERESWIDRDTAIIAGFKRVDSIEGAQLVGRNGPGNYAGIAIPNVFPGPGEKPREWRLRRDQPDYEQKPDGTLKEKAKYVSPPGRSNLLFFPRGTPPEWLRDVSLPVLLTEGEKKAIALSRLASHETSTPRFLAIGLYGVWNWRGVIGKEPGPNGERRDVKGPIPDFDLVEWKDRRVHISFDKNVATNESVQAARRDLAIEMERRRGAHVFFVDVPLDAGDDINGIDDLLALWGPDRVLELIQRARPYHPTIILKRGKWAAAVREAVDVLCGIDPPLIYDRGGQLVRPVRVESTESVGGMKRRPGSIVLHPVDPEWVRNRLSEMAGFLQFDARSRSLVPIDPPPALAKTVAVIVPTSAASDETGGWSALRGVVRHPVLTPDGRYIPGPGYDPETHLLIDTDGEWPDFPSVLTHDVARAAARHLREHLRYFPWVQEVDRAVALSQLLSALACAALDATPLHATSAPVAGTGKSLGVDVASVMATGVPAPVLEYARDPAEAGKRLDGALLAGDPIIAIDNIQAPLEGSALCQTITQASRRIRIMGTQTMVTVPCTALVCATGNNLEIRGDLVRRTLVCRLDARMEFPEKREIPQDLIAETVERRPQLVMDALTIIGAYLRAGCPDVGVAPLGGFEQWSKMVRQPLVWAGEADPAESIERLRTADPSRQETRAVLAAWHAAYGDKAVTCREVVNRADETMYGDKPLDPDLAEALGAVAAVKGRLDSRKLGYWLRNHVDSMVDKFVLRSHPGRSNTAQWSVKRHDDDGGDGGDRGISSNPNRGNCHKISSKEEEYVTDSIERVGTSPLITTSPPPPGPARKERKPTTDLERSEGSERVSQPLSDELKTLLDGLD